MRTLREYKVSLKKCAPAEHAVDLDDPNVHGLRTKLGGEPDWEQSDDHPECSCYRKMTFVAQIDSIEHDSKYNPHRISASKGGQDYMFGDVGMIYVFFCFDCLETRSVFQCS